MKTNQIINLTLLAFFAFGFMSCEKEIDVKYNSKESKLVIEAEFDAYKQVNSVKITKTIGITNNNVFPLVSGAKVTIVSNDGYFEELQETESGIYQTKSFVGKAGSNYLLKVYYDGKTYEARSIMPTHVALDTLLLAPLQLANMKVVSILPVFKDPAGEKNYYSFVRYLNGTK
ncbi:MAG: DUF4249 domain-containing protein, partial [Bacteroidia bacterium]|nr:DUF4249 domain-containing protein [Bacteroidia bacterium]